MKNFFKNLRFCLLLVLTGAMIVSAYRLTEISQSLNEVTFYGKRVYRRATETKEEVTNLSSKVSKLNDGITQLNDTSLLVSEKLASLETKAESYAQNPLPPPELLPLPPESLLDDIQRFQAEKAKQEGKNHTDPPESDPWGDLFESIPDEPPPPPKEKSEPEVVEYDRLVI